MCNERAEIMREILDDMIEKSTFDNTYNQGYKDGLKVAKGLLEVAFELEKEEVKC